MKPIRIFYSTLTERLYATKFYREDKNGRVVITGAKFDVTDEIGTLIDQYGIAFKKTT